MAETFTTNQAVTHNFLGFSIIELASQLMETGWRPEPGKDIEIEVKLNGHDVKFSELIKRLEEAWDHSVDEEVKKRCSEILDKEMNEIVEIVNSAKSALQDKLLEKGIKVEQW